MASGGTLQTRGTTEVTAPVTVQGGAQMTVLPDVTLDLGGDLTVEGGGTLDIILDNNLPNDLFFAPGAHLVASGAVDAGWATLTERDAGQGWGGIIVEGSLTTDDVSVEYADVGVAAYEPGSVLLENSTLRHNGTGLEVFSAGGVTLSNVYVHSNGIGIDSGFLSCYNTSCPCFTSCRPSFTLLPSTAGDPTRVQYNTGAGVLVVDADARIEETRIRYNGSYGLGVSNGEVEPFRLNIIEDNGSYGTGVTSSGYVEMSPQEEGEYGVNRVKDNDSFEIGLVSGGLVYLGEFPDPNGNGRNSVYDTGGGIRTYNATSTEVEAVNTFWDTLNPAPSNIGPVDESSPLSCDYTVDPPGCPFLRPGGDALAFGARTPADGVSPEHGDPVGSGPEAMADAIRALRAALAAAPASSEAAGLVYGLGSLHRRDSGDELGEWAATEVLLGTLRASLALPAALVEAVIASEPEAEAREVVRLVAEAYARRAGEGSTGGRGTSPVVQSGEIESKASEGLSESSLSVWPNPSVGQSTLAVSLPERAHLRLAVYDVLGRRVALLADGPAEAGRHRFSFDGQRLPAGIYLVRAEVTAERGVGAEAYTERITLVR